MPFFSLTDIKIKDPSNTAQQGSLLPSAYESNVLRYPLDIGSLDKGHYMVIHVNQQVKTQFKRPVVEGDLPTILENQRRNGTAQALSSTGQNLKTFSSDVKNLNETKQLINISELLANKAKSGTSSLLQYFGASQATVENVGQQTSGALNSILTGAGEVFRDSANLITSGKGLRTIERTTDTIALYMPDTLSFTHNQQYSSLEFGNSPLALLSAAAAGYSYLKDFQGDKLKETIKNITPFIASRALQNFGGNAGTAVFASATGTVINPQLELIYTSPSFREFRFDFMLYPRSSKEALEIHRILNRLRFHQAPELLQEGAAGGLGAFFLVPPSEFDIKFYYNGRINPNIPPISTCVLTSIETDYAPNGWSAYEVPGNAGVPTLGKTGTPVGIKLSLVFQETEILTKQTYNDKGGLSVTDFSGSGSSSVETRMSSGELR
jgi:hypothetical protein